MEKRFGCPPKVTYFDTPVIVDNVVEITLSESSLQRRLHLVDFIQLNGSLSDPDIVAPQVT